MTELVWIRSHVELLLQQEWDQCRVYADKDGDWPYRRDTAACWVSVLGSVPIMVRIWAHAAYNVKARAAVLREINDLQSHALSVRISLNGDVVQVSQTVSPVGLTQPVLS